MFDLFGKETWLFEFFIILDVLDIGRFQSSKDKKPEYYDWGEGHGEYKVQEGNIVILQIFLSFVFLKKWHS